MKVLLLGANGMLGQAIKARLQNSGYLVKGVDRSNTDYCFDLLNDEKLDKCIKVVDPDIIINTAAIVDLEYCEGNPGNAYHINSRLPGVLANICNKNGCYLVQISTDHFYCGDSNYLHKETYPVKLVNEYARTKFAGETFALTCPSALVIRTNIVGFRYCGKQTFVEWALCEAQKNKQMTLFSDFYTSSIHTIQFAKILEDMIKKRLKGIYNLASHDVSSKEVFLLELTKGLLGFKPKFIRKSVKDLSGTKRGDSLGLDTGKIEEAIGYSMPSLDETICSLKEEYEERKIRNEI